MEDEKTCLEENIQSQEEIKIKPMWQVQKEGWYDKLPLTQKHLDIIIAVGLILLVITFIVIGLDAADIFNPFGY